ncbi:biotin/lipoyl-containing protein [Fervidobacterium thailandense]|uniref:Acetyl-CoA carboxylase biotin carboxyl carrier protein subunit n=1 Tax=Fervidobacterium thailandense TaxID=1008305 RepID=A0A1E3G1H8_9BACT|nr:biotin/lipoyl-containing protein [Fervidobacterium thailandense]ODN30107.1 acetyl-CoA carboxylase biotin carboxyl carrier protein subunit [Fervidobacterium thailandense]
MVRKFLVKVNGREYVVEVEELGTAEQSVQQFVSQRTVREIIETERVESPKGQERVEERPMPQETVKRSEEPSSYVSSAHAIVAPMSGVILKVLVSPGQKVEHGQKVVILEAMKMENDIVADRPGVVKSVKVKEGDNVDTGQILVELE